MEWLRSCIEMSFMFEKRDIGMLQFGDEIDVGGKRVSYFLKVRYEFIEEAVFFLVCIPVVHISFCCQFFVSLLQFLRKMPERLLSF